MLGSLLFSNFTQILFISTNTQQFVHVTKTDTFPYKVSWTSLGACTAGSEYYNHIIREQSCFVWCGLFNSEIIHLYYTVLTEKMIMNNKLDRMSKNRTWPATWNGIFQHLSGGTEGNHKNHRTAGVPAEFRSRHFTDSNNRSTAMKTLMISLCVAQ
jgi:hypothetical protein